MKSFIFFPRYLYISIVFFSYVICATEFIEHDSEISR